jgi:gluconokinase
LDGHLCGFLGVEFTALCERVWQGGSDDEIAEWCFAHGLRPNPVQARIWNEFARKFGWNDRATAFIASVRTEDGLQDRADLLTAFDSIDFREGRFDASQEA